MEPAAKCGNSFPAVAPLRRATQLRQQCRHWFDARAVGKDLAREHGLIQAQVIFEQALEHGAHIGCRLEVAAFMQVGELEPRPVRDHAAALESAADEECNGRGAVWSVPSVPLMRAVRPNSVTTATTVSR